MANIGRSLLIVIAGASQKELASQIKYLKVENAILRTRISGRGYVTEKESRWRLLNQTQLLAAIVVDQLLLRINRRRKNNDGRIKWILPPSRCFASRQESTIVPYPSLIVNPRERYQMAQNQRDSDREPCL